MTDVRVEFIGGRPCLVIFAASILDELAEVLDRSNRGLVYRGSLPAPSVSEFVAGARRVSAIAQLVPQGEPRHAELGVSAARWMTTAEAAQRLGITQRAVRKRIAVNQLPARQLGGRWLIDLKEISHHAA